MPVRISKIYLRWYRDRGNGQKAVDNIPGIDSLEDELPIAVWKCDSYYEASARWVFLLKTYDINAMTVTEFDYREEPAAPPLPPDKPKPSKFF